MKRIFFSLFLSFKCTHPSLQPVNLWRFRGSVWMFTKRNLSFCFKVSNSPVGKGCLDQFTVFLFCSIQKYSKDITIYFQLKQNTEKMGKSRCENHTSRRVQSCEVLALMASCEIQHSFTVVSANQRTWNQFAWFWNGIAAN